MPVHEPRAFKTSVDEIPLVAGLDPKEGWVDMQVQFLVDADNAGAEEIQFVVAGHGTVLDGDDELEMQAGDVLFTPKNRWHGFRNTSDTEDVVLLWCWAGAASREAAGYEVRDTQH